MGWEDSADQFQKVAEELAQLHVQGILKVSGLATHENRLRTLNSWLQRRRIEDPCKQNTPTTAHDRPILIKCSKFDSETKHSYCLMSCSIFDACTSVRSIHNEVGDCDPLCGTLRGWPGQVFRHQARSIHHFIKMVCGSRQ